MNAEERIRELEEKLHLLSAEMETSYERLNQLQLELRMLKQEAGIEVASAKSPFTQTTLRQQQGLEHFIGLKLIHLVGIIVLVIGLSIGVKYAIDGQLISEVLRIVLAYAAGLVLFILSLRLRKRYSFFSAILFSGSMASIYFITYAAFAYYQFIPASISFIIMVALTIYTSLMALRYDRIEIAVIGMVGAYGIPFLISSNSDKFELLFSYIVVINTGIVYLSFRKSWKLVGLLAMLISWGLFTGWALIHYKPEDQLIGFVFILTFYLLFCLSALSFMLFRKQPLSNAGIQQIVINNIALYVATLCLFKPVWVSGLIFIWFAIAALVTTRMFPDEKILQKTWMFHALLALLIWIALQCSGLTVTLLWVAVSVALFSWGIASRQSWIRLTSVCLIGITLAKLLLVDSSRFPPEQKIICYIAIGALLLVFSFYYQRRGRSQEKHQQGIESRHKE